MNIISKFNLKAYFTPVIIIFFISFPIITNKKDDPYEILIFTSIIPFLVVIISIYNLRNNLLNIIITEESISFRRYFGYGNLKTYNFDDLDSYNIQIKKEKSLRYEILNIVKDNKKIMQISQFYIYNYSELKLKIEQKLVLETK